MLVHQTTFHTFRVPFAAASLGIPSVWGPIAGGESTPPGFAGWLGSARSSERWRAITNRLCLAVPAVRRSLRDAGAIFVSNHTTLDFLPQSCRAKCEIVPPNTLREDEAAPVRPTAAATENLHLLYVGNCVATRAIPLVLEALARLDDDRFTLTVVGRGPALEDWRREAAARSLAERVTFAGQVGREELDRFYAAADVLVFPALRDAGGSALLEAMSKGIPVVCFDWGGPAEMLDASCGVKIAVTNPEQTIRDLAAALGHLRDDPAGRTALATRAIERVRARFTWAAKRLLLESTYRRLIGSP